MDINKSLLPRISVVDFTNNTTYFDATLNYKKKNDEGSIYVGATPIGIGVGAKNNNSTYNEKRKVDSKLSSAITSPLEDMIHKMGGAKLISRSEIDKIDEELKLQDSGLLDENSLVEFGQLLGANYILTGSIDNVEESYQDLSKTASLINAITLHSDNKKVKIGGVLVHLGTNLTDGLTLKTKVTVKMIEIETGKIVFTKQLKNKKFIGKLERADFDQIVGGIKASIIESLPKLQVDLSKKLAPSGYITQLRSKTKKEDEIIAQINLGQNQNIQASDLFNIYQNDTYIDPITNKQMCDITKLPLKIVISDQINTDNSWGIVKGDTRYIKLGQFVKKVISK
jgi:curli biogenesis system outer membrane secretion channel CsgG